LGHQDTKSFLLAAARQQRPPLLIAWPSVLCKQSSLLVCSL